MGLHRKEVHPAPPGRGQGQNVSRGGAHASALTAENKKRNVEKISFFLKATFRMCTDQEASGCPEKTRVMSAYIQ